MTKRFSVSLRYILFLLVAASTVYTSCRKSERDEDLETLSARDNALAYHIFDDAWREVHRVAMQDTLLGYYDSNLIRRPNACIQRLIISDTVPVFPLELTINYSDVGEVCNDGFQRFGVIKATFGARYITASSTIIIGFDGYRKDDFDVEGLITVRNLGFDNDQPVYSIQVEDGRITGNNIDIEWEGIHTYRWVQGSATYSSIFDDVFRVTGVATGENSRGVPFTNEITSAYEADLSCQWFTKGRSELTVQNLSPRFINYEDTNACNNILVARRNNTYLDVEIPF